MVVIRIILFWGTNSYYSLGITDGRIGYYSKAQYDAQFNAGYTTGTNAAKTTFSSWTSDYVSMEADYYGHYCHRYTFYTGIPNLSKMTHGQDYFIEVAGQVSNQSDGASNPWLVSVVGSNINMASMNGTKQLKITVYYNANFSG